MIVAALLIFGVILVTGWVSNFARRLVSGLACMAGAILAVGSVMDGSAFSVLIAATGLMSAGSAGLLGGAVPRRFKIGFLAAIGLPWVLALWMGVRLKMAGSTASAADGILLVSAGVLVLYVALIAEEVAQGDSAASSGAPSPE